MGNIFSTYALISSLYEQGQDYLDCFWPFVISPLNEQQYIDFRFLQTQLKSTYELEVPQHVLRTLANRAQSKGYVQINRGTLKLTTKGSKYVSTLQTPRDIQRQINELEEDVLNFFKTSGVELSHEELDKLFISFIGHNIAPLLEFIDPLKSVSLTVYASSKHEKLFANYLIIADEQKHQLFQTFAKMLLGSILSSILNTDDPTKIDSIIHSHFRDCEIYLDTNFVLSILNLRHSDLNIASQELFEIVKRHKCKIKVFDFTVSEITNVVTEYIRDETFYPSSIRINSDNDLTISTWSKAKSLLFLANIDKTLQSMGISVERTGIILRRYNPPNIEQKQIMSTYKPKASDIVLNHDLASIELIRKVRRHSVRKIEESKAMFLTSDIALSKFNFTEFGHKESGTIPEVIVDRLLANILWLKDPHLKLSLPSIISVHLPGLFINKLVWKKFYSVLVELNKDGKIKDEDITVLLYHGYIETVLTEVNDEELDKITPAFALEQIEKAHTKIKREQTTAVRQAELAKEEDFVKRIKEQTSIQQQKFNFELLTKMGEIKENLHLSSLNTARTITNSTRIGAVIVFVSIPITSYLLSRDLQIVHIIASIISLFVIIVSVGLGDINKIWKRLQTRIEKHVYTRKIRESGIDEN